MDHLEHYRNSLNFTHSAAVSSRSSPESSIRQLMYKISGRNGYFQAGKNTE